VTAAPLPVRSSERPRLLADLDLTLVTVFAIAWVSAAAATCVTLWLLVGVVGSA
jgi:hypothetical protein